MPSMIPAGEITSAKKAKTKEGVSGIFSGFHHNKQNS